MWTHVYVQQANSVFAGVSHPRAESHSDHSHHEHTVKKTSCARASCSDPIEVESGAGGGPAPFSEIETTNYFGTSHFPCCITNFPQGWPKFAQSTVFFEPSTGAVVLASLVPLRATIAAADNTTLNVESGYPFTDTANVTITAVKATVLKLRIPVWATRATVNGAPVPNGTLHAVPCAGGAVTKVHVDLRPEVKLEMGWGAKKNDTAAGLDVELVWTCKAGGLTGDTFHRANLTVPDAQKWCAANAKCGGFCTQHAGACGDTGLGVLDMHFSDKWGAHRPTKDSSYSSWTPSAGPSQPSITANAVGVSRGSLVFALHPRENRTIVRRYNSTPPTAGQRAPDYEIKTADRWNFALVPSKGAVFNSTAAGWTPAFAFNDSAGAHPFSVTVTGRRVSSWGFWRGSNITDVPPASPVDCGSAGCGAEEELTLVPLGLTNIRISVFPWVK
eukprot:SAG11_NODE_44_length_20765_cov_5.183635_24_plen_445_part_00